MFDAIIGAIVPVVIIILVLAVLAANIRVVPQSRAFVIERLGAFQGVWGVGLHFKIPFIERVAKNVSLKEQVVDFPPQPVITKDNVTMQIDTVIYFQITDPKLYTYGVENPMSAIENLTATTLRNIIGDLELDQSLTSRDHINSQMRAILDEATDNWGIKVNRVELKNIMPPRDIQESMEKQMRAERERRESILQAEGTKQSQILVAEGEKQAAILRADAEKQAAILQAEGAKQAKILEAEAQAEAIMKVQQATADAIRLINEADPNFDIIKKNLKTKYHFDGTVEYEGQQIGCAHPIEWYEGEGAWQVEAVALFSLDRSPPQEAPQGGSLQGSSQVHDSSHALRPHRPPRSREHASSDVPRRPKRRHCSGHVRRPGLENPPNPRKAAEARWPWHRGRQRRGQQACVFARPPSQPPQEQPHHRNDAPRPAIPLPSVPSPRFFHP